MSDDLPADAAGRPAGTAGGAGAGERGLPVSEAASDIVAPGAVAGPIRLVAFDLDGVVYRGGMVLPGVPETLQDVLARGLDLRYVSNNATAHRRVVSERLAGMGVPAGPERVLTSAFVTARWLRARLTAGAPVMVVGEEGLLEELREVGLTAYYATEAPAADDAREAVPGGGPDPGPPAAVIVAMDRGFTFQTLAAAQKAVRDGALFVATNRDATYPTPDGLLPGAGAVVAAVATASQAEPLLMGKPSPALAETLTEVTGLPAAQTLFVGDRVSTDIVMGHEAGMVTVLVLTGIAKPGDARNALADHVLRDLTELPALLDSLDV